MSPRTTSKAAVLEAADKQQTDVTVQTASVHREEASPNSDSTTSHDLAAVEAEEATVEHVPLDNKADHSNAVGRADANQTEDSADVLAQQLEQLLRSVSVVEDLSRRAREVAGTDLAFYDALRASQQQYVDRLGQAVAIRDQALQVHDRAFGVEARSAAQPLVADAERVARAFTELSNAWQQRASAFLEEHPDVELLLAERRAEQDYARRAEAQQARESRLRALVSACEGSMRAGVLQEARRCIEVIEREFSEQQTIIDTLQSGLRRRERDANDDVARHALATSAEHQARGDLEGAVNVLEQLDVHGLSLEVSQEVFGQWSIACSRLAQAAGTELVRYSPGQGRGVILYADPAYPNGLIVFSSLGMGRGFEPRTVITDGKTLDRARGFRAARPLPITSYSFAAASHTSPQAPVRH